MLKAVQCIDESNGQSKRIMFARFHTTKTLFQGVLNRMLQNSETKEIRRQGMANMKRKTRMRRRASLMFIAIPHTDKKDKDKICTITHQVGAYF